MKLENNIKKFRSFKKMTQDELADLLGTTSKSISRWEQDITYPDITMLPLIANVFNIAFCRGERDFFILRLNSNGYYGIMRQNTIQWRSICIVSIFRLTVTNFTE